MARRRKDQLTPCLTEAQREAIRRGEYPSLKATRGPVEIADDIRRHDLRIARRAAETGLEINERRILSEVAERTPAVEESQLASGEPLED